MKIQELVEQGLIPTDHWLTKARVLDEDVSISDGRVTWENGTWEDGTWEGGTWEGGIWKYGTWKYGTWIRGTWKDGIWKDGTWKGGIWEDGIWKDGIWEGVIWKDGTWEDGIWKDGTWIRGTWKGGTWERGTWQGGIWKDGYKQIGFCTWTVLWSKDFVKIGCKDKTYKEWDLWFDSENTFETPRNTEEFRLIHNSYLAARAVRVIEYGDLTEKEDEKALF